MCKTRFLHYLFSSPNSIPWFKALSGTLSFSHHLTLRAQGRNETGSNTWHPTWQQQNLHSNNNIFNQLSIHWYDTTICYCCYQALVNCFKILPWVLTLYYFSDLQSIYISGSWAGIVGYFGPWALHFCWHRPGRTAKVRLLFICNILRIQRKWCSCFEDLFGYFRLSWVIFFCLKFCLNLKLCSHSFLSCHELYIKTFLMWV